jgi:hypothetical protein
MTLTLRLAATCSPSSSKTCTVMVGLLAPSAKRWVTVPPPAMRAAYSVAVYWFWVLPSPQSMR